MTHEEARASHQAALDRFKTRADRLKLWKHRINVFLIFGVLYYGVIFMATVQTREWVAALTFIWFLVIVASYVRELEEYIFPTPEDYDVFTQDF